jgi:hypothetical protein
VTNTSGNNVERYDEAAEMLAYDRLPKTFRRALADSAFKFGAIEMDKYRKAQGLNYRKAAGFIKDQERLMIENQADDIWGPLYLPMVYPKMEVNKFDW